MSHRLLLPLLLLAPLGRAQLLFPIASPTADTPSDIPAEVISKVDPSVVSIQHERAGGSGFILSEDGYILTNGHVIQGEDDEDPTRPARSITVILHDERKFPARVLGFSMDPDVALLKIEADTPLQPVEFADSRNVAVGRRCFAVGTPVGLKRTFTGGILSNVERTDLSSETVVFQTDAAINSGNSGGPLFDQQGRVLGLNTYASRGQNNLGFTIPIHVALDMVEDLKTRGRFVRSLVPFFFTSELYDELARSLGQTDGVLVTYVMEGSSAEKAGLRAGDILTAIDGEPVTARTQARLLALEWKQTVRPAGETVRYSLLRGPPDAREPLEIAAVLEELGPMPQYGRHAGELMEHRYAALGLGLEQLVPLHHIIHEVPIDQGGVLVKFVAPNSVASRADLQPQDIVTHVNGRPVAGMTAFRNAFDASLANSDAAIELHVTRKKLRFVTALAPDYLMKNRTLTLVATEEANPDVDLIRRELLARGARLRLATPDKKAIPRADLGDELSADVALEDLEVGEGDTLLLIGGSGGQRLRNHGPLLRLLQGALASKTRIAAVGSAALLPVLASEKPLDLKITLLSEDSGEATRRGATYTGKDVESDGHLLTTTGLTRDILREFLLKLATSSPYSPEVGSDNLQELLAE